MSRLTVKLGDSIEGDLDPTLRKLNECDAKIQFDDVDKLNGFVKSLDKRSTKWTYSYQEYNEFDYTIIKQKSSTD